MHKTLSGAMVLTGILFTGLQAQAKPSNTPFEAEKLAEHNERFAALRARLKSEKFKPSSETHSDRYKGRTKLRIKDCKIHCLESLLKAYQNAENSLIEESAYPRLKRNSSKINTKKVIDKFSHEEDKERLQKSRERLEEAIAKASQLKKSTLKRQRL